MRDRQERAQQALRDAAAEFMAKEAGHQSLVTITHAEVSADFTHATLFMSVMPEDKAAAALGLANRNIKELKDFIKTRVMLPRMPHIEFALERGE